MKKIISVLVLILIQVNAYAVLRLELTQGVRSALPIALVPFTGSDQLPMKDDVSEVVGDDLRNSGEFKLYTDKNLPAVPRTVEEVQLNDWRKAGIEYLILGGVRLMPDGQYQVMVSLIDVFRNGAAKQLQSSSVLYSRVFTVPKSQLRALAHHISDVLYQDMVGQPGIFSTKLAYVFKTRPGSGDMKYQLVVSDYDGYNEQSVVTSSQPLMSPAWSPDGKQIAFVSFQKTFPAIYTVNLTNGKITQLTKLAGINGAPAWSPDGSSLAYVSSTTGQPKLFLMDVSTKKVQQLTKGNAIDTEPSFSPDGNSLVFTSSRGGGPQIYKLSLPQKYIERMTYNGSYNARASYSPDGKQIVMLHREGGKFYVGVQSLDTDTYQVLTKSGLDESPNFAPNGKMVIYATKQSGKEVLAIVSTNGQVKIQLPETQGGVQEPAWSPYLSQ